MDSERVTLVKKPQNPCKVLEQRIQKQKLEDANKALKELTAFKDLLFNIQPDLIAAESSVVKSCVTSYKLELAKAFIEWTSHTGNKSVDLDQILQIILRTNLD